VALRDLWVVSAPEQELLSSVVSRLVLWVIPSGVYLVATRGRDWAQPLGLGFPLGPTQLYRTIILTVMVTWALFAATATRNGLGIFDELHLFSSSAQPRFTAPLFEELLFRGVILSELLNWTHKYSRSAWDLRARFLAAQFFSAAFFVCIHWPSWWGNLDFGAVVDRSIPVFAVGAVLGFVFAHTRSIWPCIWLHWLNNELSLMP